jgi:hypothetical protein
VRQQPSALGGRRRQALDINIVGDGEMRRRRNARYASRRLAADVRENLNPSPCGVQMNRLALLATEAIVSLTIALPTWAQNALAQTQLHICDDSPVPKDMTCDTFKKVERLYDSTRALQSLSAGIVETGRMEICADSNSRGTDCAMILTENAHDLIAQQIANNCKALTALGVSIEEK